MRRVTRSLTTIEDIDVSTLNLPKNVGAVYGDYIQVHTHNGSQFEVKQLLSAVTYEDVLKGCMLPPDIIVINDEIIIPNTENMAHVFLEIMAQGYAIWHTPIVLSKTSQPLGAMITPALREHYGPIYL